MFLRNHGSFLSLTGKLSSRHAHAIGVHAATLTPSLCHPAVLFTASTSLKAVLLPCHSYLRFTSSTSTSSSSSSTPSPSHLYVPRTRNSFRPPAPFDAGKSWGQKLVTNADLTVPAAQWTPDSKRSAVVGRKIGMMQTWNELGVQILLTVVEIDRCQVLKVRTDQPNKEGLVQMEMGACDRSPKNVPKPMLVHFHKARVPPKAEVVAFRCSSNALLPVGWEMSAKHFVPGQYIDATGISTGYGFTGVMARYGFSGQPATHGVSVSHRSLGSTGMRQDPGRVFKNKKMPGRHGVFRKTVLNLQVYKVDPVRNLVYIMGPIPGNNESYVYLRDAIKKKFNPASPPPFPTFVPSGKPDVDNKVIVMPKELLGEDPFAGGAV